MPRVRFCSSRLPAELARKPSKPGGLTRHSNSCSLKSSMGITSSSSQLWQSLAQQSRASMHQPRCILVICKTKIYILQRRKGSS